MRRAWADRRLLLGAIVLFGLIVRLAGVGDRLSADEGYSWLVGSAESADAFLDRLAAYENTPPLFYLLLTPLPLDDEAWLRLPSLVASTAAIGVLYAIVRPLLGTPAALLAALGLAVAPYHVSFANYSRGFMLAGLGVLLATWGVARLAEGGRRRWWWLYAAGTVLALYAEYDAGLALAALVAVLLWVGRPPRREVLLFGALPAVALAPWLGQLARSLDALDATKVAPVYPGPGPGALRDVAVPLAFGEHGAIGSNVLRWLQLAAVLAVVGCALWLLWRGTERHRLAARLLGGVLLGTLALHAIVALAGPDLFAQRYLTVLIPLATALVAGGVAALPWRPAVPVAAAALAAAGVAVFAERSGRELEPDLAPVQAAVLASPPRAVLTNSATVAFYLPGLPVVVDRPFGLGPGSEGSCPPGCVVVDDTRVAGGARAGEGVRRRIGPFVVRAAPAAPPRSGA